MGKLLITEHDVAAARRLGGLLRIEGDFVLTPSAQDALHRWGVRIERASLPREQISALREKRVVAIAADHGGFDMKEDLRKFLESQEYLVLDFGTHSRDAVDYPDFALRVAQAVSAGDAPMGIVIDGAGIGSSIAANKVPGIRAAKCDSLFDAKNSRLHNNANVLTLGARLERNFAREMARTWLETPFEGGRHERRVHKIGEIERRFSR